MACETDAVTPPRRAYLVCATQRSGSTLLCELLKATGVAGRPEEYFEAEHATGVPPHPGFYLESLPRTGLGIRDDPAPADAPAYSSLAGITDYREHLRRTWIAATTPNGVFAAKLMHNQLAELRALAGGLEAYAGLSDHALLTRLFGDPAYVRVRRRDTVRQAVSLWRALQTRRWRGAADAAETTGDAAGHRPEPEYRFAAIDHLVGWFTRQEAAWSEHFARHAITPLQLDYEDDLTHDPERAVRAVLAHVGVPAPADLRVDAPPMRRQSDALSEQWVTRYRRERR